MNLLKKSLSVLAVAAMAVDIAEHHQQLASVELVELAVHADC